MNDPGIELDDGVCDFEKVLPDQLRPAQALKEADRFTPPIPRIHAHTQGCHDYV